MSLAELAFVCALAGGAILAVAMHLQTLEDERSERLPRVRAWQGRKAPNKHYPPNK